MFLRSFNAKAQAVFAAVFGHAVEFIIRNPRKVLVAGILLAVLASIYAFKNLAFLPDFAGLNNNQSSYNKNYRDFSREFDQEPAMVVVAEGNNVSQNEAFLGALAQKLAGNPYVARTIYKVDLRPFLAWAADYLSPSELQKVLLNLEAAKPLFARMDNNPSLVSFWENILSMSRNPGSNGSSGGASGITDLVEIVNMMTEGLEGKGRNLQLPGALGSLSGIPESQYNISLKNGKYELYLTLDNGHYAFLSAYAVKDKSGVAQLQPAVEQIRQTMLQIVPQFPGVEAHLTGEPVMGVDEMEVAQHDIVVAGIISFVLCSTIFILGFMELKKPIISVITLLIGTGWSIGYITLSVRHLNVFTISLFPMLIGLALDFSIQFMGRYREERARASVEDSIRKTYLSTGTGLFAAALTTALGFFGISFTSYTGIAELGTATGGSLILCFISTMTVLPALLVLSEKGPTPSIAEVAANVERQMFHHALGLNIEKFLLRHAGFVVFCAVILTFVFGLNARNISFDHNILDLEAKGTDSVATELKLIQVASKSSIFAVMVADNPEEARIYVNELQTLPSVSSVQSPLAFIPQDQEKKFALLSRLRRTVQGFNLSDPDGTVDVKKLAAALSSLRGNLNQILLKLATTEGAFELFRNFIIPGSDIFEEKSGGTAATISELHDEIISLNDSITRFLSMLRRTPPDQASSDLTRLQNNLFDQIRTDLNLLRNGIPSRPVTLQDLPPLVKHEFIGKTGKILIEIFPSQNIWERPSLERFVTQLQAIDPNVTGAPVLIYYTTEEMLLSYETAATVAIVVILVVAFLEFRSLYLTFLTLIPLGVGLMWLIGLMVLCGKSFNPANMITLPVILGIGVAFGVYVVNRFREERQPSIFSNSTGKSVLLSAMTSTAGFASLLFVSHQGLKSLGFTMTVGLVVITLQALIILPSLIKITAGKS